MHLYLEAFSLEPNRYDLLETAGRFAINLNDAVKAKSIFKDRERYYKQRFCS